MKLPTPTFRIILAVVSAALGAAGALALAEDREAKVRNDRTKVESGGAWIYGDLQRGFDEAKKGGKPLLVVLRCIPCDACAKLDEDVVERTPALKEVLGKFVCVRLPFTNGLDLSLFQFDFDQSWAAFALNADGTIYARYGTRSHRTKSEDDISIAGFGKTLEGALALHANFAKVKASLAAKRGAPLEAATPEELPSLREKYKTALDWEGKVVPSCIHCHMVGEAERKVHRTGGKPIPEKLLFPYPNPSVLGLVMDPAEASRVKSVTPGSSAEKDGFRAGDELATVAGQLILSTADLQWVLHGAADAASLDAPVFRDGKPVALKLTLAPGWRRNSDISWRVSSWDLRRMTTGGMVLTDLTDDERKAAGIDATSLALRVGHVGQYGEHAVAKNAGFQKGDLVVALDGRKSRMTESEWMTTAVNAKKPGDKVEVAVLRDGKKLEMKLPMQ